jgi:uncharacterized protein (DUF433 family)
MPAQTIVDNWEAGYSIDRLSKMWVGITREQIQGIVQWYASIQQKANRI